VVRRPRARRLHLLLLASEREEGARRLPLLLLVAGRESGARDWVENERCRKGKTPVVNDEDDACVAVARRPLAGSGLGKLLNHSDERPWNHERNPSQRNDEHNPRTSVVRRERQVADHRGDG